MIRRLPTWLFHLVGVGLAVLVGGILGVLIGGVLIGGVFVPGVLVLVLGGGGGVLVIGALVLGVTVDVVLGQVRVHSVQGHRTPSSGLSGRSGGLRVSRSGALRDLLHACTSVERLADYLLDRAIDKLPPTARARFAEEWQDHRQHRSGWRRLWWALGVRATARRIVTALGPAQLPRDS